MTEQKKGRGDYGNFSSVSSGENEVGGEIVLEGYEDYVYRTAIVSPDIVSNKHVIAANMLRTGLDAEIPTLVDDALNKLLKKMTKLLIESDRIVIDPKKTDFKVDNVNRVNEVLLRESALDKEKSDLRVSIIKVQGEKTEDESREITYAEDRFFELFFTKFVNDCGQDLNAIINGLDPQILRLTEEERMNDSREMFGDRVIPVSSDEEDREDSINDAVEAIVGKKKDRN